ncbi:MAG: hypothetical protein EZS28_017213, partial [Streblomastix strix]
PQEMIHHYCENFEAIAPDVQFSAAKGLLRDENQLRFIKCDYRHCNAVCRGVYAYTRHINQHFRRAMLECPFRLCSALCRSARDMEEHIEHAHENIGEQIYEQISELPASERGYRKKKPQIGLEQGIKMLVNNNRI